MDEDRLKGVYYFVDKDGDKPVKEFINSLTQKEQAKVYAYITELKKQGNNLRRPRIAPINGLWNVDGYVLIMALNIPITDFPCWMESAQSSRSIRSSC